MNPGKVMAGGLQQALAFGQSDACSGTAVGRIGAAAHFDKNYGVAIAGNEVDFPMAAAVIFLGDGQAMAAQEIRSQRFSLFTARIHVLRVL